MIALLAAVPEETRLIRQTCTALTSSPCCGIELWTGSCDGQEICLAHTGIGKAAAAAAATAVIGKFKPGAIWSFGCGGAYTTTDLRVGDLAIADIEIFGDEGIETAEGFQPLVEMGLPMIQTGSGPLFNAWPVDSEATETAFEHLTPYAERNGLRLGKGPFVTVSICTGTSQRARQLARRTGGICENMEGAAIALACKRAGVSFLEVRGISNLVEDRDTSRWDLPAGMTIAQKAILELLRVRTEA